MQCDIVLRLSFTLMETVVIHYFYLFLPVIICNGFPVHGPAAPLTVQLGHSVILPCFVKTPLPIGELEVEWKRNESLVHLWQEGASRPESQNQRYHERAHFFTEEISHGNFSLFLTNVTREDSGVYKCVIHTNLQSGETLIEIKEIERLIVSGAHSTSAYAGEDITLNCSVDSHISPDNIEEVSWKKIDGNILVLLYQEGEVLTDSSHKRYRDRVEFFSIEERNKGNFSLRLKDVQTGDKGLYICEAFSGTLSANTTVEVLQLGFSSMHIGMFVLCILGFVIGSLILGYLSFTSVKQNDNSGRARAIQWAHVLCPNITMSIVFILWSITEGFISEAVTCSVINLIRISLLLWISVHLVTFTGVFRKLIYYMALPLQYTVTNAVVYSSLIVDNWHKGTTAWRGFTILCFSLMSFHPVLVFIPVFIRNNSRLVRSIGSMTELSNSLRIISIILLYGRHPLYYIGPVFSFAALFWGLCASTSSHNLVSLIWISVLMVLDILSAAVSIYICYNFVDDMKERDASTCMTVFLYILMMMMMMMLLTYEMESSQFDHNTNPSLSYLVVYVFGTAVVIFVNAVALVVELILKTRNGERTMDLRVILLPTESVFAVCCLALIIADFWKKQKAGFIKDAKKIRGLCLCKQFEGNSPPHNEVQELKTLNPEPQPSGS